MQLRALSLVAALALLSSAGALTTQEIIASVPAEAFQKTEPIQISVFDETTGKNIPIHIDPVLFRTKAVSEGQKLLTGCNTALASLPACSMPVPGWKFVSPKGGWIEEWRSDPYESANQIGGRVWYEVVPNSPEVNRIPGSGAYSLNYEPEKVNRVINDRIFPDLVGSDSAYMDPGTTFGEWPPDIGSASRYNSEVQGIIKSGVDYDQPTVTELIRDYGVTVGDSFVDGGFSQTPGTGTGGGTTGGTPTTGFEPGTGTTCWGDANLNLWEKLLTRVFMPCTDWGQKFDDLGAKMATKKPMGYVSWLSQMGEGYYAGDSLDLCIEGDIAGKALPCFNIKKSPAGKWYEDHNIRGAFMFVFWIVVTMFFVRFATK